MASHPLSAPPPKHPEAPIPSAPPMILKFVLIGDAATGKTAFRERFVRDRFTGIYRATIGCDFLGRVVQVDRVPGYDIDDEEVANRGTEAEPQGPDEARLQVWDTAGQERFRSLAPAFYRSSDACLILYSLTSSLSPTKTAESITSWFHEFSTKCPVDDPRLFSWACVGTKADEVRGDPEREKRAKEIQDEVERALQKLVPPRGAVEGAEASGDKQKRRRAARVGNGVEQARPPPTVSVEVLPPKGSKEAAARRRHKLAATRATSSSNTSAAQDELPKVVVDGEQVAPSALDPQSSNRDPNLLIDRPPTSRTSTANSTTYSNAGSVATGTTTGTAATFELDAPLSDLLYATSPPPAPAHFGPAGAPPAVYIGGPYRDPEGRLLGSEDVDAVLEEGGGAPDHRREGLEEADELDELEREAEEIPEGQEEDTEREGCELEEEEQRYEDEGIRHFRWTSAKTGEGVQEVFEYLTRRVLAIRRAEALSEDEHAGTPYIRDSHTHRRHQHRRKGSGGVDGKDKDGVIRIGERETLTLGEKLRQACCS